MIGGGMQQLDRAQGHRDRVTRCHPGQNSKVGKMVYSLGDLDPNWATCSKSGQIFLDGQKTIHVDKSMCSHFGARVRRLHMLHETARLQQQIPQYFDCARANGSLFAQSVALINFISYGSD